MIKVNDGDVILAKENIIAHQVNCQGVMGSGVAKGIKLRFPYAYERYYELCNNNKAEKKPSSNLLGRCQIILCQDKYVANLFGQDSYGLDKQHTNYGALTQAFSILAGQCREQNMSVAMPYGIGCGRGGGDWSIVFEMIEEIFVGIDVTIYKI